MKLYMLYIGFAIIATVVNLLAQEIVWRLCVNDFRLAASIFAGTLVGLLVKYVLDKKYIFDYQVGSHTQDIKIFFLYGVMGLLTTLIFWLTEFAFDWWFAGKMMRYTGAVIGLLIGYIIKYQLDKKFVFIER